MILNSFNYNLENHKQIKLILAITSYYIGEMSTVYTRDHQLKFN